MKLLSAKAYGYIGIYDGLGLNEIKIDFTKCKNKLIIIRGLNGSGKSTLYGLLQPFPDSNSCFIKKTEAKKVLVYQDKDIIYKIKYVHPVNDNGDRLTTKGYISKTVMGEEIQLNDNGNISSCKDIIFSEFKLDSNFLALSQLSSDDRGLVDKKPAERKKYMSSIINTLEVYNNMCKTLTKRSSVFKSIINSLTSKMDSIGDEKQLTLSLSSIETRIANLSSEKDKFIGLSAKAKSTIELLDPDLMIQKEFDSIQRELNILSSNNEKIKINIGGIMAKNNISSLEEVSEKINILLKIKTENETQIQIKEANINSIIALRQQDAEQLESKTIRIRSYTNDCDVANITYYISLYTNKIQDCIAIFKEIGIIDNDLSKDDYIIGLDTLKSIKEIVDIFKSNFKSEVLTKALTQYIDNYPDLPSIMDSIEVDRMLLRDYQKDFDRYSIMNETMSSRPNNCKIDSCPYISSAIEFDKDIWTKLGEEILVLENSIKSKSALYDEQQDIVYCLNYMNKILRHIDGNKHILKKLPNGDIYSNTEKFITRLLNNDTFDDIDNIYSFIDRANVFEEYSVYKDNLKIMQDQFNAYNSKSEIVDELVKDIDVLTAKLNSFAESIMKDQTDIFDIKTELSNLISIEAEYRVIIDNMSMFNSNNSKIVEFNKRLSAISINMNKINDSIEKANMYNNELNKVILELDPLNRDREKIKYGLTLINDYKIELDEFNKKYEITETVKNYSSPTKKEGIQKLFMEIYMNNVLVMANTLLSLLFNGKFSLMPFDFEEDNFNMPCIGDGLIHDDVSNMSTSQVCMISMVISFALLRQASTKYNIPKLDEIDGGLDTINRAQFANLLYSIIDMLECEQCIIISHNNEFSSNNADVIALRVAEDEIIEGNVIYRWA